MVDTSNGTMVNNNKLSMSAADLIRTLDSSCSEMNLFALQGARDAEEAKKNARAAAELAQRFRSRSSFPKGSGVVADLLNGTSSVSSSVGDHNFLQASSSSLSINLHGANHPQNPVPPPPPPNSVPPPPPPPPASPHNQGTRPPPVRQQGSGRKRKNNNTVGKSKASSPSAERRAKDALSVSLELERTKQKYESEQMSHDETKSALKLAKSNNTQLTAQIEHLLNDMETQREKYGRKIDLLEQELERSRKRVELAEEDAQLALELAQGNAEKRDQLEVWLQRSLKEVKELREREQQICIGKPTPSKRIVRFADESSTAILSPSTENKVIEVPPSTPSSRPSQSLVSAGRKLLQRSLVDTNADLVPNSVDRTPEMSADRRRRLRNRLHSLSVDVEIRSPSSVASSPSLGASDEALEICRNTAKILKASGKRLNLSGRWWDSDGRQSKRVGLDDIHLEALAKHYCTSVEVSKRPRCYPAILVLNVD